MLAHDLLGQGGPGGPLVPGAVSSQSRTNCLSKLFCGPPGQVGRPSARSATNRESGLRRSRRGDRPRARTRTWCRRAGCREPGHDRWRGGRSRGCARAPRAARSGPRRARTSGEGDVFVVAALRLGRGGEDRLGQAVGLAQPGGQRDTADRARGPIVLEAGAREIAAHHTFHGQGLGLGHDHRASRELITEGPKHGRVGRDVGRDHVVRQDVLQQVEPEERNLGEDDSLVRGFPWAARRRTRTADRSPPPAGGRPGRRRHAPYPCARE